LVISEELVTQIMGALSQVMFDSPNVFQFM